MVSRILSGLWVANDLRSTLLLLRDTYDGLITKSTIARCGASVCTCGWGFGTGMYWDYYPNDSDCRFFIPHCIVSQNCLFWREEIWGVRKLCFFISLPTLRSITWLMKSSSTVSDFFFFCKAEGLEIHLELWKRALAYNESNWMQSDWIYYCAWVCEMCIWMLGCDFSPLGLLLFDSSSTRDCLDLVNRNKW